MDKSLLVLTVWVLFLLFYFFGTQRFYIHRLLLYTGVIVIVVLSLVILIYRSILPHEKFYYLFSFFIYYFALLLLIKWKYRAVNRWLVKIKWIRATLIHKDFTFVITGSTGSETWEDKLASPPSWFDHLLSALLLLGPMLLTVLTIDLFF
jgi:hypothetical protein